MIDPLVSLAFALQTNPGVYALLLGSGLSRSAGIPTGWEIVLDLLKRLAALEGQPDESDLVQWYRTKHGHEPNYSRLLADLCNTPDERKQLLRGYFEATEEEAEQKIKVPTPAHRAIADLVKSGTLRVIITTNFDRLLETALADVGVQPIVISSVDALQGAPPISHSNSFIVKINGDYLDSRIKNTTEELEQYDPALNRFLDRVLDEFGLIICGWSGDWDIGLSRAIERCPTRRFSTFWTRVGELTQSAQALAASRSAAVIDIKDADHFFVTLKEKIQSLVDIGMHHPLSSKIAAAQVKRYLVRPESRIQLHDLVHEETERAYELVTGERFHVNPVNDDRKELGERLEAYERALSVLFAIMATGCFWGEQERAYLWHKVILRLANQPIKSGGQSKWNGLRLYPAMACMYVGGIAGLCGLKTHNLAQILTAPIAGEAGEPPIEIAASKLSTGSVMQNGLHTQIPGPSGRRTPLSDYLFDKVRPLLQPVSISAGEYERAFQNLEYLIGALAFSRNNALGYPNAPIGRSRPSPSVLKDAISVVLGDSQLAAAADSLFGGSAGFDKARTAYNIWLVEHTYAIR